MTDWVQKQMPEPDKLYTHLKKSFNKLDSNSDKIPSAKHQVKDSLDNARRQLENGDENNWTLKLNPFLVFGVNSERDFANTEGQVRLGGNIEVRDGEYEMFSSSLIFAVQHPSNDDDDGDFMNEWDHCCVETGGDEAEGEFYHILERFHWDIDTGEDEDEDEDGNKPVCHFQVGGNVSDPAFDESYESYHYCSNGLDKPRMPHPPMDPTLVFNMLINQYQSLESFNQPQWDGVVDRAEETIWGPYFEAIHGMVNIDSDSVMKLMQPPQISD